jgi:uncharacterized protein YqjF (DUF2071 family)
VAHAAVCALAAAAPGAAPAHSERSESADVPAERVGRDHRVSRDWAEAARRTRSPVVSQFPEINVRTYVTAGGKPGVFFFSLDAGSLLAVAAARALYSLPYFHATFSVSRRRARIVYSSRRHQGAASAEFRAEYGPIGNVMRATPGTLDAWLTERYCLYAVSRRGGLRRTEIHHPPWPLQPAEADIQRNTMTHGLGFRLPDVAPLLHFSECLHVHVWGPESIPHGSD